MKEIFETILALLKEIPELRTIDLDKGQLNAPDDMGRYPVNFPCALISLQIARTKDQDEKRKLQDCDLIIGIRVAENFVGNTSAITPDEERINHSHTWS